MRSVPKCTSPPAASRRRAGSEARRRVVQATPLERGGGELTGLSGPRYGAPDLFGVCVVATDGSVHAVGDAEVEFTIMSVSKPFVFALVCQTSGPRALERLGVNGTGRAFNSLAPSNRGTVGRIRWSIPGRSRQRASSRGRIRREVARDPRLPFTVRRARTRSKCRGVPLGVRDERSKPEHRPPPPQLRLHLLRSGGGD